jgi:membrane protease YdiL (CAAX protease family)
MGTTGSTDSFIKRHPITTYYALVLAISWGGLLIVAGPGGITAGQTETPFILVYLVTVAGPCVAGILLTGLMDGREGLRELRSRLLGWRVGVRWYAVALLIAPLSVIATLLVLSLTSPVFLPGFFTTSDKASLLMTSLAAGLVTGFLEELGWTGFAVARLMSRYGVLTTGVFVGIPWGAWHFLSNYLGSATAAGGLPLTIFLPVLLFSFLPPYRVLMVWVYDRTRSLLVAVLMHASLVTFWLASTPLGIAGVPQVTWYLAWAAVLWVIVLAVVLMHSEKRATTWGLEE